MIFWGSEKRPRLGMAQASITLDNNDGGLPLDYSEVTISRRAYRSGENEYLLNGSRVRLKDITELLDKAGLGRRTYNVIGQGLVDAVLSLQPDERRAIFEEAAGISIHQAKRTEAIAKLSKPETTSSGSMTSSTRLPPDSPAWRSKPSGPSNTRSYPGNWRNYYSSGMSTVGKKHKPFCARPKQRSRSGKSYRGNARLR
jgi:hypothetical protein